MLRRGVTPHPAAGVGHRRGVVRTPSSTLDKKLSHASATSAHDMRRSLRQPLWWGPQPQWARCRSRWYTISLPVRNLPSGKGKWTMRRLYHHHHTTTTLPPHYHNSTTILPTHYHHSTTTLYHHSATTQPARTIGRGSARASLPPSAASEIKLN